jgi:type II secretory pathway pseudopilin PulG
MNKYKSFTFLEVLITLTILSIISLLVVGLLKPQEAFKAARDAKRITNVKQIEKALELYLTENQNLNLGSSTIIYISLPDNSASCTSWKDKLPPLPSGYEYRCSANPQNIDGTGWIPIDFTKSSITNISSLPLDPINNPPYYFTYVADNNKKSFEITAYLESDKNKGENSVCANDNGTNINLYEAGNDKNLNLSDYEIARTGGTALPGGSLVWYATSSSCTPYSVAVDNTGIYVVGCDSSPGNAQWRIEKRVK